VELCLVQILVVVAIIQMRTLKAEVEKGSMRTAIGHGLLDPKARLKCFRNSVKLCCRKGMRLIFLKLVVDAVWQHNQTRRRRCVPLEEFSFLFNCFKPRNWITQRGGPITGKADHFPICQVRSQRPVKIRERYLNAR
jgi:hypothetical protein